MITALRNFLHFSHFLSLCRGIDIKQHYGNQLAYQFCFRSVEMILRLAPIMTCAMGMHSLLACLPSLFVSIYIVTVGGVNCR